MESVLQDLRFTTRQLLKNKSFTLTAILSLALGIGATTAVFSVVYGVLLDPYPYKDNNRMVHVQLLDKNGAMMALLYTDGPGYKAVLQAKSVEDAFQMRNSSATITGGQLPVSVQLGRYSPNLFTFMGVPPLLGRQFTGADTANGQTTKVAILSYLFWKKQYGASPDVLGKTIELDHTLYTIIGVAAPRFTWGDSEVYVPDVTQSDPHDFPMVFIRLKPGVTLPAAQAELEPLVKQFVQQSPKDYPPVASVKLVTLNEQVLGQFAGALLMLFAAVALLLVIGCANVSILLLARGTARMHELALRSSVGASRWRIMRQLLTESVLLALLGAAVGILVAYQGVRAITATLPFYSFPHEAAIHVSVPVLAFSVVVAVVTGILFGMSPALQLSRPNLSELIQAGAGRHSGGGASRKTHRLLIIGQVALTMVLLAIAGAATRAFLTAYRVPLGYDADVVTSLELSLPKNSHPTWQDRANKFEAVRQAVASAPGVEQAGISTTWLPPMQGFVDKVEIESKPDLTGIQAGLVLTSPETFATLGVPVLQGRVFTESEMMRPAHVALVNQTFVRKFLAGTDPMGQHVRAPGLKVDRPMLLTADGNDGWFEIIGVVGDALNNGGFGDMGSNTSKSSVQPALFVPHTVVLPDGISLLVRTKGNQADAIRSVQQRLQALHPEVAVTQQHPLTWFLDTMFWGRERFIAGVFGIFSFLGLILAATGLYSVVSYSVNQRNQEVGIRMALGAQRFDIIRLVLQSVAATVGIGIALGTAVSIGLSKIVGHVVQSSSRDPLTLLVVIVILALISLFACIWPARRAATLDPMKALRTE